MPGQLDVREWRSQIRLIGPVESVADFEKALAQGLNTVRAGGVCVIDARVAPGYDAE